MISFSRPKVSTTAISDAEIARWMRANPDKVTRLPGTKITPRPPHKVKPAKSMGYDCMPVRVSIKRRPRQKPVVTSQSAKMSHTEKRAAILHYLKAAKKPVTAKKLSKVLGIANVPSIVRSINKDGGNIRHTRRLIDHRINCIYWVGDYEY